LDLSTFAISTGTVALAELGDKTQILAMMLAARLRRPLAVLLGILAGTIGNHLLACVAGQWAGARLDPQVLHWIVGLSFLSVSVWALVPEKEEQAQATHGHGGAFLVAATTFFLAEMGDKTQVIVLALAAHSQALLTVLVGSTLGMMLVNVPTVLLGARVAAAVPLRAVRVLAAIVYGALGIATLLGVA
jgi:Ca2+/H+ antiporter, TMEM165/GDT1 family